jgi:hypothetical protein
MGHTPFHTLYSSALSLYLSFILSFSLSPVLLMHPNQFVLLSRIHSSRTIPIIGLSGSSWFIAPEDFRSIVHGYLYLTSLSSRLQVPGIHILYK